MTKRKSFTKEFKLEAIRLLEKSEKTGAEIARELGIRRNMLYKWLDEVKQLMGSELINFKKPGQIYLIFKKRTKKNTMKHKT